MPIVNFHNRMRDYGDTLHYLPPPYQKGCKKSANADWEALVSITKEEIQTATYDALPPDYRTHINSQYELNFRDMEEIDFLEAMLSYESIDQAQRAQQTKEEEKLAKKKK